MRDIMPRDRLLEDLDPAKVYILLVNDDSVTRELLQRILQSEPDYQVSTTATGQEALARLEEHPYHVVITDLSMPDAAGMQVANKCKALYPLAEVITVTEHASVESVIEAMHSKTYDYVMKPFEPNRITTSVRNALTKQRLALENAALIRQLQAHQAELEKKVSEATQELAAANRKLTRLAYTDPLTGLYNRRYFRRRLADEVDRALRHSGPLSVSVVDIDNFKAYNDAHGHPAGDAALRRIAGVLNANLRREDLAARWGGEEFIVLFPAHGEQASLAMERIRTAVEEMAVTIKRNDQEIALTISAGISTFSGQARDQATLIARADEALYRAKQAGKNRVCLADAGIQTNLGRA
jgi:two-component system cell cycle response regulator